MLKSAYFGRASIRKSGTSCLESNCAVYTMARFRRRTFHAPNLIQELSATLERRLNQVRQVLIKFDMTRRCDRTSRICDTGSTLI
jgi:hypothetical protein